MPESYDAIVIGGGPGGSTVATVLARADRQVLLLEKEKFPRFHVGESLLHFAFDVVPDTNQKGDVAFLPDLQGLPQRARCAEQQGVAEEAR